MQLFGALLLSIVVDSLTLFIDVRICLSAERSFAFASKSVVRWVFDQVAKNALKAETSAIIAVQRIGVSVVGHQRPDVVAVSLR